MRPLLFLTNAFINTFGVTKPRPEGTQRAARFIGVLLLAVVLLVILVAVTLRAALHTH